MGFGLNWAASTWQVACDRRQCSAGTSSARSRFSVVAWRQSLASVLAVSVHSRRTRQAARWRGSPLAGSVAPSSTRYRASPAGWRCPVRSTRTLPGCVRSPRDRPPSRNVPATAEARRGRGSELHLLLSLRWKALRHMRHTASPERQQNFVHYVLFHFKFSLMF